MKKFEALLNILNAAVAIRSKLDKAKRFAAYYNIKLDVVDFDLTKKDEEYFKLLRAKMKRHQLYAMTGITHDKLVIKVSKIASNKEPILPVE